MPEPPDADVTPGRLAVRRFEDGDRETFLSLYERVHGRSRMPEWFSWRYEHNPHLSHVPVFFVETDEGDTVAAQGFDAFRVWTPERPVIGLRPSGSLVDPEYADGRPLARLSEACADFYADHRPQFCFDFFDGSATGGPRVPELGYRTVGSVPTYYRVQNPTAFVGDRGGGGRLADLVADWYLEARVRAVSVDDDVIVGRYTELPIDVLTSLYRQARPQTVHVERDPTFYRWRFANPGRPATTYVAFRRDEPVAAIVTYVDDTDDVRRVHLADLVPMCETPGRNPAVRALVLALADEYPDADALVATGSVFPARALRTFGFHADERWPLSTVTSPATLAVAPLADADDGEPLSALGLDDRGNWTVAGAARHRA